MHKFNSLKFTYVSLEAIHVYVHRRDTVDTLQGRAAHQPLGGRWAGLWDLACKLHILSITWFDGCYYMDRLPIGLWGADTLVSHWRLYVAYAVWRGAFTAPIACLCCIFAHMSDLFLCCSWSNICSEVHGLDGRRMDGQAFLDCRTWANGMVWCVFL